MAKRFLDTLTSEERKQYPMSGGCVDYFPDGLALISHVSWTGNEKHNPGQSLHWSRWNSVDHADCIIRHHSTRDTEEHSIPLMHMAEEAWRVLAMLQEAMEEHYGLDLPRGARAKPEEESGLTGADYFWKGASDILVDGETRTKKWMVGDPALGVNLSGRFQPPMTMNGYHDIADALDEKSDCIIREPRDAGIEPGHECIVQFTNMGEINDTPFRTVVSDGPFLNYAAAKDYVRTNPNGRRGIASICTLTPQEESSC